MSYNPAFVGDESPLANSAGDSQSSNGIKLTSFKVLPSKDSVVINLSSQPAEQQQKLAGSKRKRAAKQEAGQGSNTSSESKAQQQKQKQSSASNKFCVSTSSSLSLIDNPSTLSSLTPSASSYSTTTSNSSIMTASTNNLCAAVECRDMRYDVGRGRNLKTILYNINVTVPEGSIYGLLGPSGCGKTTMLRCVVGRIKPKEGYVRVFGYEPNDSGSQIPGPAIGYMPQVSF